VRVIAPEIAPEIADSPGVETVRRSYRSGDLAGAFIAIAATGSRDVNEWVSKEAGQLRIPVNVVDEPELCSFIMPSVARRGRLVVSVSTSGAAPAFAGRIRREIEENLPPATAAFVELLGEIRELAEKRVTNPEKRAELMIGFCEKRHREAFEKDGIEAVRKAMISEIEKVI